MDSRPPPTPSWRRRCWQVDLWISWRTICFVFANKISPPRRGGSHLPVLQLPLVETPPGPATVSRTMQRWQIGCQHWTIVSPHSDISTPTTDHCLMWAVSSLSDVQIFTLKRSTFQTFHCELAGLCWRSVLQFLSLQSLCLISQWELAVCMRASLNDGDSSNWAEQEEDHGCCC